MKYEMIFGDDDFNGQGNDVAEVKLWNDLLGPNFVSMKELSQMNLSGVIPRGSVILAMRRIIKEPKRWMWEDKKAGRLPEVGSTAQHNQRVIGCADVLAVKDGFVVIQYESDKKILTLTDAMFIEYFNPIETPAEKAQREEDEFVGSLGVAEYNCGMFSANFEQGARAAYRKLKGGEL